MPFIRGRRRGAATAAKICSQKQRNTAVTLAHAQTTLYTTGVDGEGGGGDGHVLVLGRGRGVSEKQKGGRLRRLESEGEAKATQWQ